MNWTGSGFVYQAGPVPNWNSAIGDLVTSTAAQGVPTNKTLKSYSRKLAYPCGSGDDGRLLPIMASFCGLAVLAPLPISCPVPVRGSYLRSTNTSGSSHRPAFAYV